MKPIRFPLIRDRKTKQRRPATQGFHNAEFCSRNMIGVAIGERHEWRDRLEKAALALERGDERQARMERTAAQYKRDQMRSSALWARVFAGHIPSNDPRLEELSQRASARLTLSFRAGIWSERWMKVQAMLFSPRLDDSIRARINRVLATIASKHDSLNPWGFTLQRHRTA